MRMLQEDESLGKSPVQPGPGLFLFNASARPPPLHISGGTLLAKKRFLLSWVPPRVHAKWIGSLAGVEHCGAPNFFVQLFGWNTEPKVGVLSKLGSTRRSLITEGAPLAERFAGLLTLG
jgi:hypothetical protein